MSEDIAISNKTAIVYLTDVIPMVYHKEVFIL